MDHYSSEEHNVLYNMSLPVMCI